MSLLRKSLSSLSKLKLLQFFLFIFRPRGGSNLQISRCLKYSNFAFLYFWYKNGFLSIIFTCISSLSNLSLSPSRILILDSYLARIQLNSFSLLIIFCSNLFSNSFCSLIKLLILSLRVWFWLSSSLSLAIIPESKT